MQPQEPEASSAIWGYGSAGLDQTVEHGDLEFEVDLRGEQSPPIPLLDAKELYQRQQRFYERSLKPLIDRVGAFTLLLLLLPIMLVIAVGVLVTMGFPVLLRQERVGRHGRRFTMFKFRTMVPDRRNNGVPYVGPERRVSHKTPGDPRVTPLGRLLRRYSLDELPQFFNVVRGEMSLVGPRPELPEIVATYEPWQHRRHAVRPGVTGSWQISERGEKHLHECTEQDLEYLERLGLWLDLKILLLTPLAALGMKRGF
jgi:lipopolysaccharide/colanic/teichoic acid biosynthesis glycosyltransferase